MNRQDFIMNRLEFVGEELVGDNSTDDFPTAEEALRLSKVNAEIRKVESIKIESDNGIEYLVKEIGDSIHRGSTEASYPYPYLIEPESEKIIVGYFRDKGYRAWVDGRVIHVNWKEMKDFDKIQSIERVDEDLEDYAVEEDSMDYDSIFSRKRPASSGKKIPGENPSKRGITSILKDKFKGK